MQAPWERTVDGKAALRLEPPPITGPHVQPLAWRAVVDIARVEARFQGAEIWFVPALTLLAKHSTWAAGWSLLLRDGSRGDLARATDPDLCLRTCTWDNAAALRGLAAADNARDYLAAALPLQCQLRFLSSGELSAATLLDETEATLAKGISFERRDRVNQGGEIDFHFRRGLNSFRFTYFPATSAAPQLEALFADWYAWFEQARKLDGAIPDAGCSVAYEESVWERLFRHG